MSAAAPATTGNAALSSGGAATVPEKATKVATKARKRTSEGTDVVPPLTTSNAVTRARRARDPKLTLEEPLAFSRDLSVVDEDTEKHDHNFNTPLSTPTQKKHASLMVDKASPVKQQHKTVKPLSHKTVKEKKKSSLWDTMSHLFSPMFLLFIIGAGLGTTVWNLRPRPVAPHWDVSSTEVEKLEEFVTKTTKWIQVYQYR